MLGRQHLGIWQLLIGRHTLLGRDGTRERLGGVGAISLNEKNFAAPQTYGRPLRHATAAVNFSGAAPRFSRDCNSRRTVCLRGGEV